MNVVLDIYARVSRLDDDRQRSTDGQVLDCEARIAERGGRVGEVHVDPGRSAWNPRVERRGWERLMGRLESGATGGVVVFDLARFSRRPIEGERLILAAERGLSVLDSEGEYDLTTANGRKTFRDQLNAAAYESDRLSTRVRRGKRLKAMRGEPNTTHRPFGWEADGVTVRPSEARLIAEYTARVLAGGGLDRVTEELNERGVLTTLGLVWTTKSVKAMLLRPRNAGWIEYKGEMVAKLPGEPIVDPQVWEELRSKFEARRRGRPVSEPYVCSAQVVCGRCGKGLNGRPVSKSFYSDGAQRRQYFCQRQAGRSGCGHIYVDQRALDDEIGRIVVKILADDRHRRAVADAARKADEQRLALRRQLEESEQLAEQLGERLGRGEISLTRYDKAINPLDQRIAHLQAQIDSLHADPVTTTTDVAGADEVRRAEAERDWTLRWRNATTGEKRALLRQATTGLRISVGPSDRSKPRVFDPERVVVEPIKAPTR